MTVLTKTGGKKPDAWTKLSALSTLAAVVVSALAVVVAVQAVDLSTREYNALYDQPPLVWTQDRVSQHWVGNQSGYCVASYVATMFVWNLDARAIALTVNVTVHNVETANNIPNNQSFGEGVLHFSSGEFWNGTVYNLPFNGSYLAGQQRWCPWTVAPTSTVQVVAWS